MGSDERGKRSVSAERVKNGAGDNGFRWDTSVEAVEFPIRYIILVLLTRVAYYYQCVCTHFSHINKDTLMKITLFLTTGLLLLSFSAISAETTAPTATPQKSTTARSVPSNSKQNSSTKQRTSTTNATAKTVATKKPNLADFCRKNMC